MSRRRNLDLGHTLRHEGITLSRAGVEASEAVSDVSVAHIRRESAEKAVAAQGSRFLDSHLYAAMGHELADRQSMERTVTENEKCRGIISGGERRFNDYITRNSCRFKRDDPDFSESLSRGFARIALERMRCLLMLGNHAGAFAFAIENEVHVLMHDLFSDPSFGLELRHLVARNHADLGEKIFQTDRHNPLFGDLVLQVRQVARGIGIVRPDKISEIDDYNPNKLARIILKDAAGLAAECMEKGDEDLKRRAWCTRAEAVISDLDGDTPDKDRLSQLWSSFCLPSAPDQQWNFSEAPTLGLMQLLARKNGFRFPVDDRIGPGLRKAAAVALSNELSSVSGNPNIPPNYKDILREKAGVVHELNERGRD